MSRYPSTSRAGSERTSLYDEITNKIIAELGRMAADSVGQLRASPDQPIPHPDL